MALRLHGIAVSVTVAMTVATIVATIGAVISLITPSIWFTERSQLQEKSQLTQFFVEAKLSLEKMNKRARGPVEKNRGGKEAKEVYR